MRNGVLSGLLSSCILLLLEYEANHTESFALDLLAQISIKPFIVLSFCTMTASIVSSLYYAVFQPMRSNVLTEFAESEEHHGFALGSAPFWIILALQGKLF